MPSQSERLLILGRMAEISCLSIAVPQNCPSPETIYICIYMRFLSVAARSRRGYFAATGHTLFPWRSFSFLLTHLLFYFVLSHAVISIRGRALCADQRERRNCNGIYIYILRAPTRLDVYLIMAVMYNLTNAGSIIHDWLAAFINYNA